MIYQFPGGDVEVPEWNDDARAQREMARIHNERADRLEALEALVSAELGKLLEVA